MKTSDAIHKPQHLIEREVNIRLAELMGTEGFLVLRELRLGAAEMDVVLLNPRSRELLALEIKRARWREALMQALRAQLYCHFASAVLPVSIKPSVSYEYFEPCGIGLLFYRQTGETLALEQAVEPRKSNKQNKYFKQQVYRRFLAKYGELVNA